MATYAICPYQVSRYSPYPVNQCLDDSGNSGWQYLSEADYLLHFSGLLEACQQAGNCQIEQSSITFDVSQIDPVLMAGAIGAGFFMLVPLWAAAYGVKQLITSVRF